jgi:hypothetical protein
VREERERRRDEEVRSTVKNTKLVREKELWTYDVRRVDAKCSNKLAVTHQLGDSGGLFALAKLV